MCAKRLCDRCGVTWWTWGAAGCHKIQSWISNVSPSGYTEIQNTPANTGQLATLPSAVSYSVLLCHCTRPGSQTRPLRLMWPIIDSSIISACRKSTWLQQILTFSSSTCHSLNKILQITHWSQWIIRVSCEKALSVTAFRVEGLVICRLGYKLGNAKTQP